MVIRSFAALEGALAGCTGLRPAIAGAGDAGVMQALVAGLETGLVQDAVLTGAADTPIPAEWRDRLRLLPAETPTEAATLAVAEVRAGRADVLVKGQVDSAAYLRAVVARGTGLRASGILSNLTLAEIPGMDRLIGATDNGIVPLPDLAQKRAMIANAVPLFHALGVQRPRVAAIAASEKVSAGQPATLDARALALDPPAGVLVAGPFGYDVALSPAAARAKGLLDCPVAGRADLILFPSIEAGNATVKAWKLHEQARTASIVLGARVPVLLNSRSDGPEARRLGLILAAALLRL